MKKSSNRPCSQQIGQITYEGIEEIIGKTESGLLFELAKFPLQHKKPQDAISNNNLAHKNLSRLLEVIEKTYGHRGGQGIAIRAGRASFKNVIRLYGQQMGFAKVDYLFMPTTARLTTGLHSLAKTLSDLWQEPIQVLEDQSAWYWQMEHSPWCCERHSDESTCHFTVGLLEGYLAWASGEKYYPVVETMCAAAGHEYCAIQINKQAIE
ncbi:MAG: 4-vinyl reductase [Anaerolineaceae bacterium]|nr:4-vinyl reductase [Anaerolineaceae bacterium]